MTSSACPIKVQAKLVEHPISCVLMHNYERPEYSLVRRRVDSLVCLFPGGGGFVCHVFQEVPREATNFYFVIPWPAGGGGGDGSDGAVCTEKMQEGCSSLEDTGFGGKRGEIIGGNQNVLIANWEVFS